MTTPTTKPEKLPKPPKKDGKARKTWVTKRIENCTRAIKMARTLLERTEPALGQGEKDVQKSIKDVVEQTKLAVAKLDGALNVLSHLGFPGSQSAGFEPASVSKVQPGTTVWIARSVYDRKYRGLFKVEELAGLKIVSIVGKKAKAVSEKGTPVVEPIGVFKTQPVDYTEGAAA